MSNTEFDISAIAPSTRTFEILHPGTGAGLDIFVTVLSLDDEKMKKIQRRLTDRLLEMRRKNKSMTAEEIETNQINLLVEAITDWEWRNKANYKGTKPPCDVANVKAVLSDLVWFRKQVDEQVGDTESFFRN